MTSVSVCVSNRWPFASSSRAQLAVVVDLAVEDDPDRAVLVRERLLAGDEVGDREPAVAEPAAAPRRGSPWWSGPRCATSAHIRSIVSRSTRAPSRKSTIPASAAHQARPPAGRARARASATNCAFVDDVAPTEPPRLLGEAEEPFEACALHPAGRPARHSRDDIDRAPDAHDERDAEAPAVLGEPELLLRRARWRRRGDAARPSGSPRRPPRPRSSGKPAVAVAGDAQARVALAQARHRPLEHVRPRAEDVDAPAAFLRVGEERAP